MENKDWLIGRKLFKLARAITNRNNAYLKELGITGAQAESLIFIADNQGLSGHQPSGGPGDRETHDGQQSDRDPEI